MANIQQSVNSILSSAQGGAFLFAQTPLYKEQAALTQEKKVGKILAEEDKALNKNIEEGRDLVSTYERSKELDEELYRHNLSLYHKTGDKQYFDEALKYTPSRRKDYDELIAEERGTSLSGAQRQAAATQQAEASYSQRAFTLQNTMDTLNANKEYLSAKQRGQLSTISHTLAKKGVIEYGNK